MKDQPLDFISVILIVLLLFITCKYTQPKNTIVIWTFGGKEVFECDSFKITAHKTVYIYNGGFKTDSVKDVVYIVKIK